MFEIGNALRDARVRRDISLQQAEEDTKIRVKYIQAMENEDFDILPGGTYVKGFIRTYAEYLGLDYQVLLDEYNDRFGDGEHREHIIHPAGTINTFNSEPEFRRGAESRRSRSLGTRSLGNQKNRNYIVVAVLAVAIIALLAYLGWGNSDNNEPSLITTTGAQGGPQETPAPPPETTPRTVQTQTQPQILESLVIASTKSDNWIEVRRGGAGTSGTVTTGQSIWQGILSPGDSKSFTQADLGSPTVILKVGSVNGLTVTVNDQRQDLPMKVGGSYLISASGMTAQ